MKFILLMAAVILVSTCEKSCTKKDDHSKTHVDKADISAKVNDTALTKAELDIFHKRAVERYARAGKQLSAEADRELRGNILRKMIDEELIRQKALAEGITVDRFERVEAIEKYKAKLGGQKVYDIVLKKEGLTNEEIQKTLVTELHKNKLIEKVANIDAPSDEEIEQHYLSNQELYTSPEMVRARHILLKFDSDEGESKEALVIKKAQAILAEAKDKPFVDLVQKYSEGQNTELGGDLGYFSRGKMVKAFEDLAFNSPLKTPVGPVKTEFGYHILFVEDKRPSQLAPISDVRARIVELLTYTKRAEKAEGVLKDLRNLATIKVFDSSMTQEEYEAHRSRGSDEAVAKIEEN